MFRSEIIKTTLIAIAGLILAAILNGGIYQIVAAGTGGSQDYTGDIWAYRLNRLTGDVVPFHHRRMVEVEIPPGVGR